MVPELLYVGRERGRGDIGRTKVIAGIEADLGEFTAGDGKGEAVMSAD